jgi:hypothetical protein
MPTRQREQAERLDRAAPGAQFARFLQRRLSDSAATLITQAREAIDG